MRLVARLLSAALMPLAAPSQVPQASPRTLPWQKGAAPTWQPLETVPSSRASVLPAPASGPLSARISADGTVEVWNGAGVRTVRTLAADATALPFTDDRFDGAWLVSMLGQVPDPTAALREARRVVRPGGRVVVGELAYDPHGVFFGDLRRRARESGMPVDARIGGWPGYFARLRVPTD